jgi:hypothetical protein
VDVKHIIVAKMFKEEVNYVLKGSAERQPIKKERLYLMVNFKVFFC